MQPSLMSQLSNTMAQGQSPMNVQTLGSPMYQPSMVTPNPSPMPDKSPATMMGGGETALHRALQRRNMPIPPQIAQNTNSMITLPIADQNQQQPGVQIPVSEAELIIKALDRRLQHKSKMEASAMKVLHPDFSESPTAGESAKLR